MKPMMISAMLMSLFVLSAMGPMGMVVHAQPTGTPAKNVWIFYMCGDNELTPGIVGAPNNPGALDKMRAAGGSDSDVTIIAMVDTVAGATDDGVPYDDGIYLITGSATTDVKLWEPSSGELSMGDLDNLAFFIKYVQSNYPADRYLLTIWDHGGGWGGVISDNNPSGKTLKLNELESALTKGNLHFDLIQFEACLMDTAEVGYELSNNANVMVASEEVDYMSRPYTEIVLWLKANPQASAADLGKQIVDGYFDIANPDSGTLAVIDLTQMPAVATSMNNLGNLLIAIMNMPGWQSTILAAGSETQRYQFSEYADIIDFTNKLDARISHPRLQPDTAAVRNAVDQAVLYERHKGTDLQNSHGLSVWLYGGSTKPVEFFVSDLKDYQYFHFVADTSWADFNAALLNAFTLPALTVEPANPYVGNWFILRGTVTSSLGSGVPNMGLVYIQKLVGATWVDIEHSSYNAPAFDFPVLANKGGTYTYRARFYGINSPPIDVPVASLSITYPTGGETWYPGRQAGFEWTSTNIVGPLRVTLMRGDEVINSWTETQPSGQETFTVSPDWYHGNTYKVCITDIAHPEYQDCSEKPFTISENPLKVISPNGGEYWPPLSTQIISWSSKVCSSSPTMDCLPSESTVTVEVIGGSPAGGSTTPLAMWLNQPLTGTRSWRIPEVITRGWKYYKVRVTSEMNPDLYDTSDWWFYVDYPPSTPCNKNVYLPNVDLACINLPVFDLSATVQGSGCPPDCPLLGISKIYYSATGAVNIPLTTVAGDSAFPVVDKEGLTTITYYTEDILGNKGPTQTYEIMIDRTPPTIIGSASPSPNGNGWNNGDVTVQFTCTDSLSGILSCTAPTKLTSDGMGLSMTGEAKDNAGNTATTTVGGINIDKTPPEITISSPVSGAKYILNEKILAAWSVSDALSNIASSSGTISSGSPIDTVTVGTKTFSVQATDKADNQKISSVTYIVESPAQATQDIITYLSCLNLPKGTTQSLTSKLNAAINAFNNGNNGAGKNTLNAFINEVKAQRCKKIPCDQADVLIGQAQRIIGTLNG
jgi:hypothetical protein